MIDKLSSDFDRPGVLVLNYGDPSYLSSLDVKYQLTPAEDIFLRLIAYLPFVEAIVVPGRNILDSEYVYEAVELGQDLLRENLVIPERRAGVSSFDEVARVRNLQSQAFRRAEFLDKNAAHVREFRWSELSTTYRSILSEDLASGGAFRRIVPGAVRGRLRPKLDLAHDEYLKSGAVTPEGFVAAVTAACPEAGHVAHRWAMAHYYLTPTHFDDVNIRQVPREAVDLLIRGRLLDEKFRPTTDLAPGEHVRRELAIGIGVDQVRRNARAYCEAAMKVREEIPEARALFKKIAKESEIRDLGQAVSAAVADELKKQLKLRWIDNEGFSLGVDATGGLLGGATGLLLDFYTFSGASLLTGAAGAVATSKMRKSATEKFDRKNRPWKLAIDHLRTRVSKIDP